VGEISLLHIGDIHFGDHITKCNVIQKCETYKSNEISEVVLSDFQKIRYELFNLMEKRTHSAILLSGDICFHGKIESYEQCIELMKKQLQNDFYRDITDEKTIIIAGNHDIDIKQSKDIVNPERKFENFLQILEKNGFPKFPVLKPNSIIYEKPDIGKILLISANSCIHWADPSFHPHNLVSIVQGLSEQGKLDKAETSELVKRCFDPEKSDSDINDVPYLENIQEIVDLIRENDDAFPILFLHHNILPKTYYKKKVYNGLLNAGGLRNELHKLNRPVMVLHGHLHVDPIEVITCPKAEYNKSKIICVSAPLLFPTQLDYFNICGFNEVKIIFSKSQEKKPIGCQINFYRPISKSKKPAIVKFFTPPDSNKLLSDFERELLNIIYDNRQLLYLSTLFEMMQRSSYPNLSIIEINDAVSRLSWLGLVQFWDSETEVDDEANFGFRKVGRLIS